MKLLHPKFQLKSSVSLGAVFLFLHIGAIFCVYFIQFNKFGAKVGLIFCSIASLFMVMRNYIWLSSSSSIVEFGTALEDGKTVWYLQQRAGDCIAATIDGPIFNSNYLIIINFILSEERAKVTVPIAKDALSAEEFRKLKMLLKTLK